MTDEELKERNRKYQRTYKERHPERVAKRSNTYWKNNPERKLYHKAKQRAKAGDYEFSIDVSDIIIPDVCPVLGIPIFHGVGKVCDNSPSLDKINPKLGYVKGNVSVISYKANRYKNDLTVENLENLLAYAKKGLTWAETH